MLLATKEDKVKVVRIIEESFKDTPSVIWVVKNDSKIEKRLKSLAEYMFDLGLAKKGVYLSNDKNAVAIIFRNKYNLSRLIVYYHELKLLFKAIGIRKIFKVLKRQAYLKKQKPAKEDFLYFWLFGASDEGKGKGGAHELQKGVFQLSKDMNLPIFLETTVAKNQLVYQRYGFTVYHTWHVEEQDINMWFMHMEPGSYNSSR